MTSACTTPTYEIRVAARLDDHWSGVLGDLTLRRDGDDATVLTGPLTDQAQLHGVLARVRDLGVPLLSLRTVDPDGASPEPLRPTLAHPLRTERLTLRPATAADADATWTYRRLASVSRWQTEVTTSLGAYRATFTDPARLASTVVVELATGTLVGDVLLRIRDARAQADVAGAARHAVAELGWVLDPAHCGRGYATEAIHALVTHCFTDLGVRRVVASCFLADDASWRLMERLGMRRETHAVAESLDRSGQWVDTVTYAVLADEWPG